MIKYKKELKEVQTEEIIICDRCGLEDKVWSPMSDMLEIRHHFGYGSRRDGAYIEADICEKCFDEIVKSFHINVREYENGLNSVDLDDDIKGP